MIYGYIWIGAQQGRNFTGAIEQLRSDLEKCKVNKIYIDTFFSLKTGKAKKDSHKRWRDMQATLKSGDTVVVPKLHHIECDLVKVNRILSELNKKGIRVKVLEIERSEQIQDIEQFYRALSICARIEEEMREELKKEREKKSKGGRPRISVEKIHEAEELLRSGYTYKQVTAQIGLSRSTLYRRCTQKR